MRAGENRLRAWHFETAGLFNMETPVLQHVSPYRTNYIDDGGAGPGIRFTLRVGMGFSPQFALTMFADQLLP